MKQGLNRDVAKDESPYDKYGLTASRMERDKQSRYLSPRHGSGSSLVGRVEDWRVSLGRSLCSRLLKCHVAKEQHCPLESRSRAWNSLASLRRITQLAVERSTDVLDLNWTMGQSAGTA